MTTISTNFSFRLTSVTGTPFNVSTRQNVKKRIAKIVYLAEPTADATKLAYVGSQEITPEVNLFIGDRSDSLPANSRTSTTQEFIATTSVKNVNVANSNFLITQQFVEAESGYLPLYYKHNLPSTVIPESIQIFDSNYNKVGSDQWKAVPEYVYDETTGSPTSTVSNYNLFNSLTNVFDTTNDTYTIYFVQYTASVSGTETTYTEIINNEKAYLPATSDDFWYITPGDLKPWVYAYYLENYNVQLPTTSKFAIKYLESQRISVKHPTDYTDTQPWFPRVVNGEFKNTYNGYASTYEMPEFTNQAFTPIEPYKFIAAVQCEKIDDRLLKFPHQEIQTGTSFNYISIIFEKDGVVQHAITTNSSLNGTNYYDFNGSVVTDVNGDEVLWSTSGLLGFDRASGIVNVDFDILDSYKIYADYPYKENHYLLTGLTMNPIFNQDVHKQTNVIYLVPKNSANGNSTSQTASIMWVKVARSGKIISTNQDSSSGNENLSQNTVISSTSGYFINGVIGLHYSWDNTTTASAQSPATVVEILPSHMFTVASTDRFPKSGWLRAKDMSGHYRYFKYVDKTDTAFELSSSITEVPTNGLINIADGRTVELVNFINERTTNSDRIASDEIAALGSGLTLPSVFSQYFVLAALSVNPPYDKNKLSVIDIREDGGGIDPDKYEEAKLLNPEIQWMDSERSFNGQIYPSNAVMVVKLPHTILNDFTLDNIRQIVSENITYGVYPLIRFYGYEPRIISMTPGFDIGSTVVKWQKEGPEFTYDIWHASAETGPWTRANDYLLTDGNGAYNSFTVTGLDAYKSCYIKITMEDRYYSWWYGYSGYNSIEGGLGLSEDAPVSPFGNAANFSFNVDVTPPI